MSVYNDKLSFIIGSECGMVHQSKTSRNTVLSVKLKKAAVYDQFIASQVIVGSSKMNPKCI